MKVVKGIEFEMDVLVLCGLVVIRLGNISELEVGIIYQVFVEDFENLVNVIVFELQEVIVQVLEDIKF